MLQCSLQLIGMASSSQIVYVPQYFSVWLRIHHQIPSDRKSFPKRGVAGTIVLFLVKSLLLLKSITSGEKRDYSKLVNLV